MRYDIASDPRTATAFIFRTNSTSLYAGIAQAISFNDSVKVFPLRPFARKLELWSTIIMPFVIEAHFHEKENYSMLLLPHRLRLPYILCANTLVLTFLSAPTKRYYTLANCKVLL
eukprot:TRINITY_DN1271_c0_g1_i1.p4 TRINITY_DN1271_c0_g1~~TRINITY_DN1271_c0_g1_i1.p4  ORF type:complete len:115 (+),score=2.65 TRINITY_DN1271_c0_g1_i1:1208-1552(+)